MPDLVPLAVLALALLAAHGANARWARLVAEDEITEPVRAWFRAKLGYRHIINRWIECPWCNGWWSAWPVTALAWFPIMGLRYWWIYPIAVWSVAHAAGRLNHNHEPTRRS